ncbi:MAG: glycosyltransferase family 4 protein [Candidatus Thorarchaeota archaeon]
MKILIFVESFMPNKGYMEYYLAKELSKIGHSVNIITFGHAKESITSTEENIGITKIPHYFEYYSYHLPTLLGLMKVSQIIKNVKPHIILCWPLFSPLSLFSSFYQKIVGGLTVGSLVTGGPIATTIGPFNPESIGSLFRYILVKILMKLYIGKMADLVFVLSSGIKRMIRKSFDVHEEKLRIMPLGADLDLFKIDEKARKSVRKKLGVTQEETIIIWSGRIVPSKNLPLLIESLANIKNDCPLTKILIVGGGSHKNLDQLKQLSRNLKIEDRVIFHPIVSRTELSAFYNASDIAVWPGGPSISIAEVASTGLPIIIKKSPFTSYFISNKNGFQFNPSDSEDLQSKLLLLIKDRETRISMGRKSRQLIEDKLNWTTIAKRFIDDCMQVLNK